MDWSTRSVKTWITKLEKMFNKNFIVSRFGRLAVVFNPCSKSTQEPLLAAEFGTESAEDKYDFVSLVKTLGCMYQSINHAVVAQHELGRGMRQGGQESIVCFLERVQEVFSQAYGPQPGWTPFHRTKLVEAVVKGVSNRKLPISLRITRFQYHSCLYTLGITWFNLRSVFLRFNRNKLTCSWWLDGASSASYLAM